MIFVICGILVLSLSLSACSFEKEEIRQNIGRPLDTQEAPGQEVPAEEDTFDIPAVTLPSFLPANEFKNDNNMIMEAGNVVVRPRHMYWDGDMLVAECFISNGVNATVYNLKLEKLIFENAEKNKALV